MGVLCASSTPGDSSVAPLLQNDGRRGCALRLTFPTITLPPQILNLLNELHLPKRFHQEFITTGALRHAARQRGGDGAHHDDGNLLPGANAAQLLYKRDAISLA